MSRIKHSYHILPASANLLGFTFLILTSMHELGLSSSGRIDKTTSACVILFASSTLLSYLSIRSEDRFTRVDYEKWAERVFVLALIVCAVLSIAIVFDTAITSK